MTDYLSEAEARQLYTAGDAAHDFDHVLRVTRLATQIATQEGADSTVVYLAALLHDVPVEHLPETLLPATFQRELVDPTVARRSHHLVAAQFAQHLLTLRGMGTEQVTNVVHCIEAHRFRQRSVLPNTLEAQCLYDADKLDSIGAIGVARAFAYAGAHASRLWTTPWEMVIEQAPPSGADYTPVHEFVFKLRLILDTLYTKSAQLIGAQRHRFMVEFFAMLDQEMLA